MLMQPNGQTSTPASQQNPYDYILNPTTGPKRNLPFISGGGMLVKVLFKGITVSVNEEEAGLDLTQHGETGYVQGNGGKTRGVPAPLDRLHHLLGHNLPARV